jgi:hypothetical protein
MDKARDQRHWPRIQFFGTNASTFRHCRENHLDCFETMIEVMEFLGQIAHVLGLGRGTVLGEPEYGPYGIHQRHRFILSSLAGLAAL